jgi:TonB-dependent SusC/RagA subfamily outer membrane receptor
MLRAHSRVALAVLVGFVAGCASSGATSGEPPKVVPRDAPAATAVTGEDIERTPSVPVEELMTNKFPGVWILRTADGSLAIRIRGATSMQGSNEPLYIIDGTPTQPGPHGGLSGLSPGDIASIQVLKDAAATTMYGVRGANGVIIVKTKVGSH